MDSVPDKDDSMPLKKGLKPFGTPEYENEVNSKAETLYNDSLNSGTTPDSQTLKYELPIEYLNVNDMTSLKQTILKFGKEKALSRAAIGIMMKDVNDNEAKKRNYSYYEDKCMIDKQDKIFDKWVSKIAKN
jgi:hypothetical protein